MPFVVPSKPLGKVFPHPIRYRVTEAQLDLLREMAGEDQRRQSEIQRKALVELARADYPAAFRRYLIATKGKVTR